MTPASPGDVWILLRHSAVSPVPRTALSKAPGPDMSQLGRVQHPNLHSLCLCPLLLLTLGGGGRCRHPPLAAHIGRGGHSPLWPLGTDPGEMLWRQDWVMPRAGNGNLSWWGMAVNVHCILLRIVLVWRQTTSKKLNEFWIYTWFCSLGREGVHNSTCWLGVNPKKRC